MGSDISTLFGPYVTTTSAQWNWHSAISSSTSTYLMGPKCTLKIIFPSAMYPTIVVTVLSDRWHFVSRELALPRAALALSEVKSTLRNSQMNWAILKNIFQLRLDPWWISFLKTITFDVWNPNTPPHPCTSHINDTLHSKCQSFVFLVVWRKALLWKVYSVGVNGSGIVQHHVHLGDWNMC